MTEQKKQTFIIMCPPLSDYPEQLPDQSHCEPFECPMCKNQMWLSIKKKKAILFYSLTNNEIILGCYNCITKYFEENPDHLQKTLNVKI